ncbi:S9 family peptidase [Elongatibacter sediminis]|uniref:S9 family peptidase n=1 Tax=Elongatibacter sediminis TaxID=3119006 RepID=A0AAW9RHM6_9GAMM
MKIRVLLGAALALMLAAPHAIAEKLPLETFFKKPQFTNFQISPNGKELAAMAPVNGRLNIVIIDLETREPRAVTGMSSQDVSGFLWANNERILFFMDKDGSESFGIFAVNTDGSLLRTLVEPVEAQLKGGKAVIKITSILDTLDEEKDWVLVSSNDRRASYPDVFKMNIINGRKKIVQRNPGNITGWFVDWDGNVVGAGFQDGLDTGYLRLANPEEDEWETIVRARFDDPSFQPVAITANPDVGYVMSWLNPDGSVRDKAGLFRYDFAKRQFGELIYEHDEIDCCGVIQTEKKRDMIGVAYMVGKPEQVYLDERWKGIMESIDAALPDTENVVTSVDDNETTGVVASYNSKQPPRYYLYNFAENTLEWLADSRPWVDAEKMSEMRHISFQARDGMTMHGYLTVPAGTDGENLPLIINPHGGPWARDGWGYNPEAQFLANRGYAVLQVNFRGSVGFGRNHLMSSWKQWGQAMQNDVTDGVKWAIEQGIADADRVCIYGGSYGGYATMAGLTYTPELYKCGINYVGVTDLPLLFETAPDAWASGLKQMAIMVGDPDSEEEFLEEWSPSNHADKIQVPVFMAYGLQDPRVNIRHARVMEDGLEENNVPYELMIKKDEGHGFQKQENIYDFYGRMETFLAENLKPESGQQESP